MAKKRKKKTLSTSLDIVYKYIEDILNGAIASSIELKQQISIIKEELDENKTYIDIELYEKYIGIGHLFFKELFPFQCFACAVCLCAFSTATKRTRWNKILVLIGRGNGKDSLIAWFSTCLTSHYHGIKYYDIDIIANNIDQSLRPILDINYMIEEKEKQKFFEKIGDSIVSHKTNSYINARSSDAKMQDGLRTGAAIFNEIHAFQNYSKLNVLIGGLGKIDDPRTFYFTTNGEVRGSVLDDMLDTAKDVLNGNADDRKTLYLLYKLNDKQEVNNVDNWIMANPILPHKETLYEEIQDEYEMWKRNPSNMPAFLQKRMNLPESSEEQMVVEWEYILKTNQEYDYSRLKGKQCVLGIDASKTTDWAAFNLLFYDEEFEKEVCINHAFICARNRDLSGIKAPYEKWCTDGLATMVDEIEIAPNVLIDYAFELASEMEVEIKSAVIDDFKKAIFAKDLEKYGISKENGNLTLARPSNISQVIPVIEREFLNERLVWGENPMLRWATNNTKVISWKSKKTTGDNEMGNQLYAKINKRFRKTDPFMAFVHSMIRLDDVREEYISEEVFLNRGF